ncbi:MAG TPA: pre-peptidase C-terminal domain-containing protein [Pyrinomonadaceae bacterium]|nr:pre-peptidase C-terminal domain-containing protein [Pyrinomonadaceae bacterium]
MKFANVHTVVTSSRFPLRLAFFSFLCLMVFAMSSPRFGVAPAAGAAVTTQTTRLQKRAAGKNGGFNAEAPARRRSAKSNDKAARQDTGSLQPNVFCAQTLPISPGQVNGTLTANDCKLSDQTAFDEYTFSGTAGQQISITLNSNDFDTYLYLIRPGETTLSASTIQDDDGGIGGRGAFGNPNTNSRIPAGSGVITLPTTGQYSILANAFDAGAAGLGAYSLTFTVGANCSSTPIAFNETKSGSLTTGDCVNPIENDNTLTDLYTFSGTAGQQISITMTAAAGSSVDPYIYLVLPNGEVLADDNNGGGGTTARLPQFNGTFGRLPMTGTYTIVANTVSSTQSGNYTITLNLAAAPCPSTPIAIGATATGTLATDDCRLLEDSSFIDAYTFSGTAGQRIVITMTPATNTLSPVLFLLSPTGVPLAIEGAPEGSNTARIPDDGGTFILPSSGTYTILTNFLETGQTGGYTLRLIDPLNCTTTLGSTERSVAGNGGAFSFNFTTQPGCTATATSNAGFIIVNPPNIDSNGAGTVTYTVEANPTNSARSGTITVNGQTFTITQAAACTYAIHPAVRPFTADSNASGRFTVITQSGCPWTATTAAPWITITEGATATTGTGRVRYTVAANTTGETRIGSITAGGRTHTVTQTSAGTTPQIQFSGNAEFTVNENVASRAATITVTRTGDTAGAATVEYATLDDTAAVPCDPNLKNGDTLYPQGTAYARCDYATTIDTLTFNPGETTRTLTIPLINDVFQEGNETFALGLFNPQGATLGTLANAVVTIQSDDVAPPTTNPINQTPFFVRQHYLDFLDREPEAGEPWSGVLARCGNIFTGPEVNTDCDRIAVSGAFFGSPEFRLKGFFVFLYYKVAFGSANNPLYVPEYNEFVRDARRVSGLTAEEVIAKRLDFSEDFLARLPVANVFSGTTNEQFVDRALSNLGITLTSADPATGETRNSLVNALNTNAKSRAQVLRIIVESTEAVAAQFNRAFVAIQYYGYLRRTPEPQGYQNNLNALNTTNNSRLLINGFLNSIEYRIRFGANTTNP